MQQRVILPRITDAVDDSLALLWEAHTQGGEPEEALHEDPMWKDDLADLDDDEDVGLDYYLLDFIDAFWNIPNMRKDRRHFCAYFRRRFLVWLRTPQGSRGAPLSWASVAALLVRLTIAMFMESELRLQVYVDDPLLQIVGDRKRRRRLASIIICAWLVLGFGPGKDY